MKKSGLADSPFFSRPPKEQKATTPLSDKATGGKNGQKKKTKKPPKKQKATRKPGNHDTMQPRNHDTTVSRYHDIVIEVVRKAVKDVGKEAATHRFTQAEKKAIADLIYTYKNRGLKTSENEITRIAVNFIIHDYRENGEESILDQALKALNE